MLVFLLLIFLNCLCNGVHATCDQPEILVSHLQGTSPVIKLAAQEARRYLYLRTQQLFQITEIQDASDLKKCAEIIFFINSQELSQNEDIQQFISSHPLTLPQHQDAHIIHTFTPSPATRIHTCVGQTDLAVLYCAFSFAEKLGVRFHLHGDIIPPLLLSLPLPDMTTAIATPVFEVRGMQPFHDFPEGPDWWEVEEYKLILYQIAKLKMNFIGLHTYPLQEPTVWVGLPGQFDPKSGNVSSAYPTSYANTLRGNWGYNVKATSEYSNGNQLMFSQDCYGNEMIQYGECPMPISQTGSELVFDRTSNLLNIAFNYAHNYGIETCVGTEVPLTKPDVNQSTTEYYQGIFERIAVSYPIDYYWLWTPEEWEWDKVNMSDPVVQEAVTDLMDAYKARSLVNGNFTLATCGWVLGPLGDRAYLDSILPPDFILSSIDQLVGDAPVDPAYAQIVHHQKWAIPWMEDDPGLTGVQLWVNRTLEHASAALQYNCSGLLGIHWRTKNIAPQIIAMAQFSWNPNLTSAQLWVEFWNATIGGDAALKAAVILESVDSFAMPRPMSWINGPGEITLNTQPWESVAPSYQWVWDFANLEPMVDPAGLAEFNYWSNFFKYIQAMAQVGCSYGKLDAEVTAAIAMPPPARQHYFETTVISAYTTVLQNWTTMVNYFQQVVSSTGEMGTIMNLEAHSMPVVISQYTGVIAYYIAVNSTPSYLGCYVDQPVRDLNGTSLQADNMDLITCASFCGGFQPQYTYFSLQYSQWCFCGNTYGEYGKAPQTDCNMPCAGNSSETCGGTWRNSVYKTPVYNISDILPQSAFLPRSYLGPSRIVIPTVRTSVELGEAFNLAAFILSSSTPSSVTFNYRPLGSGPYSQVQMSLDTSGRQVYSLSIGAANIKADFEYYVQATVAGNTIYFPSSAPKIGQTVVVVNL